MSKIKYKKVSTVYTKNLPLCTEGELSALTGPGGGQYTFLVTGTQDSVPSAFARLFSSNKMSPPEMKNVCNIIEGIFFHKIN